MLSHPLKGQACLKARNTSHRAGGLNVLLHHTHI